ncbi:MAG: discoidin domain-containing protein [Gemmatimonadetes bacterium]|nr:discoidin domain-containing protein [Gemmatimonadota bacterium]
MPIRNAAAALLLAAALPLAARAQETRNQVLDRRALLERQTWWDNRDWDWYEARIPFFESPDPDIDATYYYRWEVVTKHLVYGSPETGYTFTEFIDRPFWSGAYGSISCPLGHQFYEVRWLKDPRIIEDFSRYWFETPGAEPRSYSNWYGDAMWATYLVRRDSALLRKVLPHMETQYAGWVAERWDSAHAMFVWDGMHDGMETNINSRQTRDTFSGAPGYRPTLNSYLFADARAIASAAALFGDTAKSRLYARRAASLKQRVQQELWDPRRQFFFQQFARDEVSRDSADTVRAKTLTHQTGKFAGSPHGREEIGYVPWQFALPDSGYEAAWQFLLDTAYFAARYGPTTTERHDPLFLISPRCCVWSGNSWPYATTQTLVAMANLLNNYRQDVVDKGDYFTVLEWYTNFQRLNGRPYIAEAGHPDTGSWDGHNSYYHSEHYFHSGYTDLIITGLVGLRPRPDDVIEINPLVPDGWSFFALDDVSYHGHSVSIIWDRDGTRYRRGAGLSILVDGRLLARAPRLQRLTAGLPPQPAPRAAAPRPSNLAVNNGHAAWPQLTASYSAPDTPYPWANDGHVWYHASPPNRWTTTGSPNAQDWLEVDFGAERTIETVKLYFLDDSAGVKPPARYEVQLWRDGRWQAAGERARVPTAPAGRRANTVTLEPVNAARLRVVFTPRPGFATGVAELEAWADVALPLPQPASPAGNLALNATGEGYPRVTASYRSDGAAVLNDGVVLFPRNGRNRWTAAQSRNAEDWVELDFGAPRRVASIELFLVDGSNVRAPAGYRIEYLQGDAWQPVRERVRTPAQPLAPALNTVAIEPVETARLRVVFTHAPDATTGLTEIVVRGN